MLELSVAMMGAAAFGVMALADWRRAFFLALAVGFVQDPVRKIIPGQPVALLGTVVGAVGLVIISMMLRGMKPRLNPLFGGNQAIIKPLRLFIILVVIQAFMAFLRFGSPVIALIGLLAYLSPLPALWLAFCYPRSERDIRRLLTWYVTLSMVVTSGIYLSVAGVESALLNQVGEGLVLHFDRQIIAIHTGFMRSPEIAAWHAATAACCLLLLGIYRSSNGLSVWPIIGASLLVIALLLTARRKYVMEIIAFLVLFFTPLFYLHQQTIMRAIVGVITGGTAVVTTALLTTPATLTEALLPNLARTESAFDGVWERFYKLGIQGIFWAIERVGWFGLGAGTGSQGSQHYGARGWNTIGGAAEGGLSKITAELGVPALILILILVVALSLYLWRVGRFLARQDSTLFKLYLGLVALLLANLPIFAAAAPVYGDPFVLLMLGNFLGLALAIPRLAVAQSTAMERARSSVSASSESAAPGYRPGLAS